jgi:hypothetical protein
MKQTLANDPVDHCKQQQALDQAQPTPAQGMVIPRHQDKHQLARVGSTSVNHQANDD